MGKTTVSVGKGEDKGVWNWRDQVVIEVREKGLILGLIHGDNGHRRWISSNALEWNRLICFSFKFLQRIKI